MAKSHLKILILRLGALGDIVHTTIMAQAIKAAYPDSEVHYCVEERYFDVVKNHPNVDKVHLYNQKLRKNWFYTLKFSQKLKNEHYDVIFNLTNAMRNNLIAFLAFPKNITFHKKCSDRHVVDDFFETAKKVFPNLIKPKMLNLGYNQQVNSELESELSKYSRPFLVISPGGETDNNRQGRIWGKENWINFCKLFSDKYGGTIFINGSQSEIKYHEEIISLLKNSVLITGQFSIEKSMCLTKQADLFMSGDTGPLHLASGLNVNTVGLFGSTNPKNVKPYGEKGYAIGANSNCKFCWLKKCDKKSAEDVITPCMASIKPEQVLNFINEKNLILLKK